MRVGPPVDGILTWYDSAVDRERRRRERNPFGDDHVPIDAPIAQIHLEWRLGKVDIGQSWIRSVGQVHRDVGLIDQNPTVVDVDVDDEERTAS